MSLIVAFFFFQTSTAEAASIAGRHIFYNQCYFDGNDAAANANDDNAIAPDKIAHVYGTQATFANYTSYSRGINGIMVDVSDATDPASITAADFGFRIGNAHSLATWTGATAPTSVTVRLGAGTAGSDRVTIIWANNVIQKQWLEVTVKATANTGLATDDVFYFGNAIGETGNSIVDAIVDATDSYGARNNPHNFLDPATITDAYDFNRDRFVTVTDELYAQNNATNTGSALKLIFDLVAPVITSLSSDTPDGSYGEGSIVDIDITFSETINSDGDITLTIETGSTDHTCTLAIADGNRGTCSYVVEAGDESPDLDVTSVSGTISDLAGNVLVNFVPETGLAANEAIVIDTTRPTIASFSPADGADAAVTDNLMITFDEPVGKTGTGYVTIYKSSDDSIVEQISTATGAVTGSGTTTITINPTVTLSYSTAYYIKIDANAFPDNAGNFSVGISDNTTWNFTTEDEPETTVTPVPSSGTTPSGGGRRGSEEGMAEKIAAAQEQILAKRGLSTSSPSTCTGSSRFRDVPSTAWFACPVHSLADAGILRGYSSPNGTPTGLFGPADPVTYAEILAIAFRVLREDHETSALVPKNRSARGTWASGIIEAAEERGVPVLTTALNVHTPATRAEVIAILLHLLPLASSSGENSFTDLPADHPYRDILLQATSLGILQGDTAPDGTLLHTLRPDDPINRAEAAKIISLLLTSLR